MEKPAKSDISAVSMGKPFVEKLGGMPPTKDFDQIMKANTPDDRSPAPGSFRPGGTKSDK